MDMREPHCIDKLFRRIIHSVSTSFPAKCEKLGEITKIKKIGKITNIGITRVVYIPFLLCLLADILENFVSEWGGPRINLQIRACMQDILKCWTP
jgi:hypothetical protein